MGKYQIVCLVCVLVFLLSMTVPALAADVNELLDKAVQETDEDNGILLWAAFSENPKDFTYKLALEETARQNKVIFSMEMALQTLDAAEYIEKAYEVVTDISQEERWTIYRLIMVLEMHTVSEQTYDDYALLLGKASCSDGVYAEMCSGQLAKAFRDAPNMFVKAMALCEQRDAIAMLLKQGLYLSVPEYHMEAILGTLETFATVEELACIQLLRSEKPVETAAATTAPKETTEIAPTESVAQNTSKTSFPWPVLIVIPGIILILTRKKK